VNVYEMRSVDNGTAMISDPVGLTGTVEDNDREFMKNLRKPRCLDAGNDVMQIVHIMNDNRSFDESQYFYG